MMFRYSVDGLECDNKLGCDSLYDYLDSLPSIMEISKTLPPQIFEGKGTPGFSGFVVLDRGYIAVHAFPEKNACYMEMSLDRMVDEKYLDHFTSTFKPKKVNVENRGESA